MTNNMAGIALMSSPKIGLHKCVNLIRQKWTK